jgi:hypothetical protein
VKSASGLDEISEAEAVDATHDLTLQAVADRRCGVERIVLRLPGLACRVCAHPPISCICVRSCSK